MQVINKENNSKYYLLFNYKDGADVPTLILEIGRYVADTGIEVSKIVIDSDEHDRPYAVVHPAENDY